MSGGPRGTSGSSKKVNIGGDGELVSSARPGGQRKVL